MFTVRDPAEIASRSGTTKLVTIRTYGTRIGAARETLAEPRTRIELAERFELCGGLPPLAHFEGRWFGIRFLSLVPGNQTARAYSEQPDKTRVNYLDVFHNGPLCETVTLAAGANLLVTRRWTARRTG